jgi:peptidoglycan/LPS O-acetylase OafA/YrhL
VVHEQLAPVRGARRSSSKNFRPDVEGLRAIAIVAVVAYHVGIPFVSGGFVGVDVFFVISGFLITGLLVKEATSTGRVNLSRFWARRARRLLPAATLVLAVTAIVSWWVIPKLDHVNVGWDIVSASFYVSNMRFAFQATDYLASDAAPSPVLHFWSLGVEEQFYVLWPLLLIVLLVIAKRTGRIGVSRTTIGAALAVLGVASFVLSLWLTVKVEPWAFFAMSTRGWEFAIGGLLAVAAPLLDRPHAAWKVPLGWVGGVVLIGSIFVINADMPYPGTAALFPVLGTAAIVAAGGRTDPYNSVAGSAPLSVAVPLSTWPMRAIGRLSYSWYLWHWPFLVLAASALGPLALWFKIVLALLSLVCAAVTFRFLENPVRMNQALIADDSRSLRLGGALSVAAAIMGVGLVLLPGGAALASDVTTTTAADEQAGRPAAPTATDSPATTPSDVASNSPQPVAAPSWPSGALTPDPQNARSDLPATYSDGCHLAHADTQSPTCAFGDVGSKTRVVLIGDSHAAQWFPALEKLATAQHWELINDTKSGCPAPDVTIFNRGLKRSYTECDQWRKNTLAAITAEHPALVVAAGTRTESIVDRSTGQLIGPSKAGAEWQAGWSRTLDVLSRAGVTVAVLRDTPWPGKDMASCVAQNSTNPSACDVTRAALDKPIYDVGMTKGVARAHEVDLSDILCDKTTCPATHGKYLVYRDTNHLTATFAKALEPYLAKDLIPLVKSG